VGPPCAVWAVVRPTQPGSRLLPQAVPRPSTKTDCREALAGLFPGRSLFRVAGCRFAGCRFAGLQVAGLKICRLQV